MNKLYNKNKDHRTRKLEEKKKICDSIDKRIKQTKKEITLKKIKKAEFALKTKNMFSKLETSLESYNEKQNTYLKHAESVEQINIFLKKIAEITGKEIGEKRFDLAEASRVVEVYQEVVVKHDSLERYYMNLVETQEDHKKNFETLMTELEEFNSLNGNLSLEINQIKQKSEALLQSNKLETYNQLLSALEDKPALSRHMLSTSYENFAIYAMLYLIQIVQRLINQIGYVENEAGCAALKDIIDSIKERFNELKKDAPVKKKGDSSSASEKSFNLFEKPMEFSLYQQPAVRNSFLELFQGEGELSSVLSEKANENIIIKYFTNPKEIKDFIDSLGENRGSLSILNNLPKLLYIGHQNLQSRIQISNTILKALLLAMGKQIKNLTVQLENNYIGRGDKEVLEKAATDMEELFINTEATENVKTSDPVVKSILEHKRRQIRKQTKKSTFALKDEFEQYVQRFEIVEPASNKIESDQRTKIFEEINELFNEIPEQNEEEEKELIRPDEALKQIKSSRSYGSLKVKTKIEKKLLASLPSLALTSKGSFNKLQREQNNRVVLQEIRRIENSMRKVKHLEQNSERSNINHLKPNFNKSELALKLPHINKFSPNQAKELIDVSLTRSMNSFYSRSSNI